MATVCNEITLRGLYRGKRAVAEFKRHPSGKTWNLKVVVGGHWKRFTIPVRDIKPCWTVALDYMAQFVKAKPSRTRPQAVSRPQLFNPET